MKYESFMKKLEKRNSFVARCFPRSENEFYLDVIENSRNFEDTIRKIIYKKPEIQFDFEVARKYYYLVTDDYEGFAMSRFKDYQCIEKSFVVDSDVGGVKVGNDDFSFIIHNGYGDGSHIVLITKPAKVHDLLDFKTSITGKFNIYDYDCGNSIEATLDGTYFVYAYNGIVVFEKHD